MHAIKQHSHKLLLAAAICALVVLSGSTSAHAQNHVYPGTLCNPWYTNTNGMSYGGSYVNETTTGYAYMECGITLNNNAAATTYCVWAYGEDNNDNATNSTVNLRVIARGHTSYSATGLIQSGGASKSNFLLQGERTVSAGDALYIEMGLPPCDISSGSCDSYTDEISYLSKYQLYQSSCI